MPVSGRAVRIATLIQRGRLTWMGSALTASGYTPCGTIPGWPLTIC